MTKVCAEEGCGRTSIKAAGRCQPHYRAYRAAHIPCKVDGCTQGVNAAKGMCASHYGMWRRHGTTDRQPASRRDISTAALVEELVWLLDAGESTWQVARQLRMSPAAILNRLHRPIHGVPEETRKRLKYAYYPLKNEAAA